MRVRVWLPPGYEGGTRSYRTLYMLDGQYVFAGDSEGTNFAADRRVARLAAAGRIQPALIVAIDNLDDPADRFRQYMPQTIYDQAEGGLRAAIDRELAGRPLVNAQFLRLPDEPAEAVHRRALSDPGRPPRHRHHRSEHGRPDGRLRLRRGTAGVRPRRLHLAELADLRRTLYRASAAAFDLASTISRGSAPRPGGGYGWTTARG